ncbi:hypothetical protein AB0F16_38865, partial [Streptomyces tanashiensis]
GRQPRRGHAHRHGGGPRADTGEAAGSTPYSEGHARTDPVGDRFGGPFGDPFADPFGDPGYEPYDYLPAAWEPSPPPPATD